MKRRTGWIAGLAAVAVLLTASATAFGYHGQVVGSVTIAAHGTVSCGSAPTLSATFLDATGQPVSAQSVAWSFVTSPSASDAITHTPTITNSHGVATTTVVLAPVSGTRRIRATAGGVSASAVLSPSCASAVLPNTSTLPTATSDRDLVPGALLLGALALAFVGALTMRRLAAARR